MTDEEKERIVQRVAEEALTVKSILVPLFLDLHSAIAVVAALQLALRHPAVAVSQSSKPVRKLIDGIIAATETNGYQASAEMMRLGDNPEHDIKTEK